MVLKNLAKNPENRVVMFFFLRWLFLTEEKLFVYTYTNDRAWKWANLWASQ